MRASDAEPDSRGKRVTRDTSRQSFPTSSVHLPGHQATPLSRVSRLHCAPWCSLVSAALERSPRAHPQVAVTLSRAACCQHQVPGSAAPRSGETAWDIGVTTGKGKPAALEIPGSGDASARALRHSHPADAPSPKELPMRRLRRLLPLTAALAVVLTGSQIHAAAPTPASGASPTGTPRTAEPTWPSGHCRPPTSACSSSTCRWRWHRTRTRRTTSTAVRADGSPFPAVTSTRLFTAYGDDFAALDTRTGARVWRQHLLAVT